MKVLPFKIPKPEQEALVYQEDHEVVFYDQLHQHEEIQISFILKGSGTLVVGDSINTYHKNDILIIGGNVPHVFKSDVEASDMSIMYTLFFTKNAFGKEFFHISDMETAKDFFTNAAYGMKISEDHKKIVKIFKKLQYQSKIERIASLLKIINQIIAIEHAPLSSFIYGKKYTDDEGKRMRAVFEHAMENYHNQITLEEVADKANMTKNAFCRYFKKRTNKTFFQFLIEIRIENACKLLFRNKEMSIATVSELCGFQNITNFNRKFKELKGITPSQYRTQY
ncbi:AraC family transcriptional regulator [Galbibacter sp. PAP.153]|uniref:AraC family transcriptional regulator n=1 Tax=Galbibacter sp. PAP.153 TaxID=3104623 RepID=UPI00300BBFBD